MSEPIIKRVSKIVVEQLGIEESAISATSSFQNDLGAACRRINSCNLFS